MGDCRRVGVAVDFSPCSRKALKWAVDNISRSGDHLILVTVRPEGHYEEARCSSGRPPVLLIRPSLASFPLLGVMVIKETALIPLLEFSEPHIMKKYGVNPDPETLDIVATASRQKEITVLLKIYWGDAREKLCESIDNIPLDCLIIGNRGLGKLKRVIMGSVSNYVVSNATCPVTVVKSHD
ncbi:UNVERIFIED_CONTAM: hypothetical protein Scaly_1036100 [Sesamum calycinum]|uniref:UspA domain-containing protein n=1 Tax=Sesamum calycinum TaxID=2727403 RepID=A0AAW2QJT5_9LAMI